MCTVASTSSSSGMVQWGRYKATSSNITPNVLNRMVYSFPKNPNPHIKLVDLRYLTIVHHDFEGNLQEGELVVNEKLAFDVMQIFRGLFKAEFPIQQMSLIDTFGAPGMALSELDKRSMAANNTSAFCYRTITGDPTRVSNHGLGCAVDINPVQNPYVKGNDVFPLEGRSYLNRDPEIPGVITEEGIVYSAFKELGWEWGGDWKGLQDYQHFEKKI